MTAILVAFSFLKDNVEGGLFLRSRSRDGGCATWQPRPLEPRHDAPLSSGFLHEISDFKTVSPLSWSYTVYLPYVCFIGIVATRSFE
jgi:hypothetical protein